MPKKQPLGALQKISPAVSIEDSVKSKDELRERIKKTLTGGTDYGLIPGTKNEYLMKPGAEKLCADYNISPRFEVVETEVDHDRENTWVKPNKKTGSPETHRSFGLYRYVMKCELFSRGNAFLGEGIGSCSSTESKYISRPRDVENTILKMAKKRAFVDAVLTVFGLSGKFTQDVDDDEKEETDDKTATQKKDNESFVPPAIDLSQLRSEVWKINDKEKRDKTLAYIDKHEGDYDRLLALQIKLKELNND